MSPEVTTVPADDEIKIDTSKMSEGKRQALEVTEAARETEWQHPSFALDLFMGRFRDDLILPYPIQDPEDEARGDHFIGRLKKIVEEKVDADEIDATGEIPQEAIDALAEAGAFGIKIPKEYGGLGLSQTNYSRAAMYVASHCGNTGALLSAHQSIGVPQPLKLFGTEEQKKRFFPRLAKGEISAFALTEDHVGSDPAKMSTRAEPSEDGKHFVINGEKLWCTNGTKAGLYVVMAATPPKMVRGKERPQITAFIVERDMPGVEVITRCHFMGLRALYNGVIKLDNVKVPRENIICAEGKGLRVALTTLNTGRLTLPAACTGASKVCLRMAREFARDRQQWGSAIVKHDAIAQKLGYIASHTLAQEAISFYATALVDRGNADIRIEAAMCKMFCSEVSWNIINETLQIRSGRGYETVQSLRSRGELGVPIERFLRDCRINTIFEGTSEIMRLFIAREALDPHLKLAGDLLNPRAPMSKRIASCVKATGFYAAWYPSMWNPVARGFDVHHELGGHLRYVDKTARRLARSLFHAMNVYQASLEKKQTLLGRFVEVGTELFAMAATCARADAFSRQNGGEHEGIIDLASLFCKYARERIERNLRTTRKNHDASGYKLAQKVGAGEFAWLEKGGSDIPFK